MKRSTRNSQKAGMSSLDNTKTTSTNVRKNAPKKKSTGVEPEGSKISCIRDINQTLSESSMHQSKEPSIREETEASAESTPIPEAQMTKINLGDPKFQSVDLYQHLEENEPITHAFEYDRLMQKKDIVHAQAAATKPQTRIPKDLIVEKAKVTLTAEEREKIQDYANALPKVLEALEEDGYEITDQEGDLIFDFLLEYKVEDLAMVKAFLAGLRQKQSISIEQLEKRMISSVSTIEKIVKDLKQANNDYANMNKDNRANNQVLREVVAGIKIDTPIARSAHAIIGTKRSADVLSASLSTETTGLKGKGLNTFIDKINKKKKLLLGGSTSVGEAKENVEQSKDSEPLNPTEETQIINPAAEQLLEIPSGEGDMEVEGILEFLNLTKAYLGEVSRDVDIAGLCLKKIWSQVLPGDRLKIEKDPIAKISKARDILRLAKNLADRVHATKAKNV